MLEKEHSVFRLPTKVHNIPQQTRLRGNEMYANSGTCERPDHELMSGHDTDFATIDFNTKAGTVIQEEHKG